MSLLIGIDLGTSTTEAAVFRNGKPEMILNQDGEAVTPSFVGLDEIGNWVVGERARAQALLAPERTAREVKRKTGSGEKIALGKAKYAAEELQAQLLSYVRNYASQYLGEDVDRAVISVPAYFDHLQRQETIRAGEKAGFTVERILNEPTAAAMSYGLEHLEEDSHVLVYDLGGGTFDVTLLEMFSGVLEVKASSGDNQLGGKDFDEALAGELYRRFRKKHGADLKKDLYASVRVREAAEECKKTLSSQDTARILLPALCTVDGKPVEMDETVTREEFEKLTAGLMERTHGPMDTVLEDAGLSAKQIDHVILVGGSTRMPMVSADLERYLGKTPIAAVHPDYAVASGAAIQGGIISGEIDPGEGLVMTDVSAFSLGVRVERNGRADYMSVVLPRNITIPAKRTETYATVGDGQTEAIVEIYQGESSLVASNRFLGRFEIKGIPARRKGQEKLGITFAYDLNGMLKVSAKVVSTGGEESLEIQMLKPGEREGKEKQAASRPDRKEEELSGWKLVPQAKPYRALIRTAERILRQTDEPLADETRESLENATALLKKCLVDHAFKEAEGIGRILEEMVKGLRENR